MIFLTSTDFKEQVKDEILATMTGGDTSLLDKAELKSIAQMTTALNVRFDAANIFNKTGTDRNSEIIMRLVDMVLYHLSSRINPGQVPTLRQNRYDDCIEWMKLVASGKMEPDLPKPTGANEGTKNDVQFGSRKARDPYF